MNRTQKAGKATRSFLTSMTGAIASAAKSVAAVPGDFVAGWRDERPVPNRRTKAKRTK